MIFVTGDTHGTITSQALFDIVKDYPNLNKNDYVIVAGDFGGCWSQKQLEITKELMKNLPYTILFVDGNHENFDILNSYPIEIWNGGKVHKLFPDVIHLIRGEIFTLEDKTFLALGGAESIDKSHRVPHISWWEDETITYEDIDNAKKNLLKYNNEVDYVVTHTLPSQGLYQKTLYDLTLGIPKTSEQRLQEIYEIIKYKKWFFGHWHIAEEFHSNFSCLYLNYKIIV